MYITDLVGRKINAIDIVGGTNEGIEFKLANNKKVIFWLADDYPRMWVLDGPLPTKINEFIIEIEITPYPHDEELMVSSDRYEIHTDKNMYTFVVFKSDTCDKKEWLLPGEEV